MATRARCLAGPHPARGSAWDPRYGGCRRPVADAARGRRWAAEARAIESYCDLREREPKRGMQTSPCGRSRGTAGPGRRWMARPGHALRVELLAVSLA